MYTPPATSWKHRKAFKEYKFCIRDPSYDIKGIFVFLFFPCVRHAAQVWLGYTTSWTVQGQCYCICCMYLRDICARLCTCASLDRTDDQCHLSHGLTTGRTEPLECVVMWNDDDDSLMICMHVCMGTSVSDWVYYNNARMMNESERELGRCWL